MPYNILMMKLAIFDVDGTLVDSESVYYKAAKINIERNHYPLNMEIISKTFGGTKDYIEQLISSYLGKDYNYKDYLNNLTSIMDEIYTNEPVKPMKGAFEILDYLKEKDIKIAIATSTYKEKQLPVLESTKLLPYIDYMVFGNEVTNSKPAPDIYLKVLEKANINNNEAIIFEDSINGILSGYNAKIKVIGIPDQVPIPLDVQEKAYKMANNLNEALDYIKEILWVNH